MLSRRLMIRNAGVMKTTSCVCRSRRRGQSLSHTFGSSALGPSRPLGIMGVSVHPPHQWLAAASRDPREAAPPTETQSGALSPGICKSALPWTFASCECWWAEICGDSAGQFLKMWHSSSFKMLLCSFKWNLEGKGTVTAEVMSKANSVSFKGWFSLDCLTVISKLVLFALFLLPKSRKLLVVSLWLKC